jgi:urease accessory protein
MSAAADGLSERNTPGSSVSELQLLHLADSALPIGSLAHSFGLETLVSNSALRVEDLPEFLGAYLEEAGVLEAAFCRAAFRFAAVADAECDASEIFGLNERLSALKPAREGRAGSLVLGQNLLQLAASVDDIPAIRRVLESRRTASTGKGAGVHHSIAFGLVAGALGLEESRAVAAFLHQSVASLVSACQRLMPLGQTRAAQILWEAKPAILAAVEKSGARPLDEVSCFTPLLDWGAMQHPGLATRLFIS